MRYLARITPLTRYIPVVTLSLIGLLVFSFILQTTARAPDNPYILSSLFGISSEAAQKGHFARLFTANLFHVNLGHLISNVIGLLLYSSLLEIIIGKSRLTIILLLSAIGGTLASLLFHMVDWMVGSSTILFGVFGGLGVLILIFRREVKQHWIALVISWCVILFLLSTLGYLSLTKVDQGAHIGGFVTGALTTWLLVYPSSLPVIKQPPGWLARAILLVLLALFGLSLILEVLPLLTMLA